MHGSLSKERLALVHALVGVAWFYSVHGALTTNHLDTPRTDYLVGWAFVAGSTLFLSVLLSREQSRRTKTERVAARGRETLEAIFKASPAGILVVDDQYRVLSCSQAAEGLLGKPTRELVGQPLSFCPQQGFASWAERGKAEELLEGFETTHTRPDGSTLPLYVQVVPLRAEGEPSTGRLVVLADISRRKQSASAAQELQRRLLAMNGVGRCLAQTEHTLEERLTKAVERLTSLVADWGVLDVVDADGTWRRLVVAHSDKTKTAEAARLRQVDLQGAAYRERIGELLAHPEGYLRHVVGEEGAHSVPTGDPQMEALSLLGIQCTSVITVPIDVRGCSLGLITLVAAESRRIYTPDDMALLHEVAGRMGALLDADRLYADAHRAEAAARESERRLRAQLDLMGAVYDSMVEGVIGFDKAGRLTLVNRAAETLIGRSRAELLGGCLHDLIQCDESGDSCARGDCPVMQVLRTGKELLDRPLIFLRRDGALVPVRCAVTLMREPGGVGGAVLTFAPVALGGAVKAWRLVGEAPPQN